MKLILVAICILLFISLTYGQNPQQLSLERIYQEIVQPLQHENYLLRVQIITLADQNQALLKQIEDLEKKNNEKSH